MEIADSNINKKIESIVKMRHIVCQNENLPCQPEKMSYKIKCKCQIGYLKWEEDMS